MPPVLEPVLCAWCEEQGIQTVLRTVEAPGPNYGICRGHKETLEGEIAEEMNLAAARVQRQAMKDTARGME